MMAGIHEAAPGRAPGAPGRPSPAPVGEAGEMVEETKEFGASAALGRVWNGGCFPEHSCAGRNRRIAECNGYTYVTCLSAHGLMRRRRTLPLWMPA